jgi:hypothetical protein
VCEAREESVGKEEERNTKDREMEEIDDMRKRRRVRREK